MNPENKCAHLFNQKVELPNPVALKKMLEIQLELQRNLHKGKGALDYDNATFKERVDEITVQWRNINTEMAELIERLPFKEWKSYTPEQLAGWTSEEHKLETWYELGDVLHFILNLMLLLGISAEDMVRLYMTKNKENIDRQKRGY